MKLYNTAARKIEKITPLNPSTITFYSCGPTVYDYTHVGHIRTYINTDVLKRTLKYIGHDVRHIMNITDVGHLTGDDDSGEDKLEKGAEKSGKTVWEVAQFYTDFFTKTIELLNIEKPDRLPKATDHIEDMIQLIKRLNDKGFVYETEEALYFDTSKFANYGKLGGQKVEEKIQQAREEVHADANKKNHQDFALWFKKVGRFADHIMHWESPWGEGFPGWHIECSAMSMKYLGETIDLHSGGIDHIPVHHENEIAQSEATTGKPFVRHWFHNNFLTVENEKMSKSLNNFYTVEDVGKKGIEPMALRLLFLQSHYRTLMNFTWEAAQSAQIAYNKLKEHVFALRKQTQRTTLSDEKLKQVDELRKQFVDALSNDLQTPQAVAVMWEVVKSNIPSTDKLDLLLEFDKVLGLRLADLQEETIPEEITTLAQERLEAKKQNDYAKSDDLRKQIEEKGFIIEDTPSGFRIKKK